MRVIWGLYEGYMKVTWGLYEGWNPNNPNNPVGTGECVVYRDFVAAYIAKEVGPALQLAQAPDPSAE